MARILIIDDDDAFRETLAETVRALGHDAIPLASAKAAVERWHDLTPDLTFLDFRMPGMDGLEVLRAIREQPSGIDAPIVMLTAFASADNTIDAMRLGAFDHLEKPIRREAVREIIGRVLQAHAPCSEVGTRPVTEVKDALIGRSAPMRALQKLIGIASASDANVLILGATGSGKELVARLLHKASDRRDGPFVPVNCAAVPAELIESELFGHVRGAFTGAVSERRGSFREAQGGTLMLDEIGDMPMSMQAKILRVLQEREVAPVGADRAQPIDVRIIAATHRDLATMVSEGRFRQDLYFRLAVVPIRVPALNERRDDVPALASHFLSQAAAGRGKQFSPKALDLLSAHDWGGNVRELRNAVERVAVVVRGASIDVSDLAFLSETPARPEKHDVSDSSGSLEAAVAALEKRKILEALATAKGNKTEAAELLGIHRQLLYVKLRQYELG